MATATTPRLNGENGCGADENCFELTVNSFMTRPLVQLLMRVDRTLPPTGHEPTNAGMLPAGAGISPGLGVFVFGTVLPMSSSAPLDVRFRASGNLPYRVVLSFFEQAPGRVTLPVNLGTTANYAILSETGISTTVGTIITGHIGVSPIFATAITGFGLTLDASGEFATTPLVVGRVYAADYTSPTDTILGVAVGDMLIAYADADSRAPDVTELGAGNIGGRTLPAGVYRWSSGLLIPTDITLSGSATDVWIFQIAQTLTLNNGRRVRLAGGARAQNVFWQVGSSASLGTTSRMVGTIMTGTGISLANGASITGRLLAQSAVTLQANAVTQP